jgi:hypothetical protein
MLEMENILWKLSSQKVNTYSQTSIVRGGRGYQIKKKSVYNRGPRSKEVNQNKWHAFTATLTELNFVMRITYISYLSSQLYLQNACNS